MDSLKEYRNKAAVGVRRRLPVSLPAAFLTVAVLATLLAFGARDTVQAALDDGLVGHWKFDEGSGTSATDSSGNGHDGTLLNDEIPADGPTWTDGQTGEVSDSALQFDGHDDYVEVSDSPEFSPANNVAGLTISAWIRPDTFDFNGTDISCGCAIHFLSKGYSGQHEWVFRLYNDTATDADGNPYRPKRLSFYVFNLDGGLGVGSYFQDDLTAGEWVHVVGVIDASNTRIYKNGNFRDIDAYTGRDATLEITLEDGAAPVRIGRRTGTSFAGAIDDVRIYNRVLSNEEIAVLAGAPPPPSQPPVADANGMIAHWELDDGSGAIATDSTGNGLYGMLVDGPDWTPSGKIGGALNFDGNDDYVYVADNSVFSPANNNLTVAAWIKPATFDFTGTDLSCGCAIHFLTKGQASQHEWAFRLYNAASGSPKRMTFNIFSLDGSAGVSSYFQDDLVVNEWIHVVGVINDSETKIYKNGILRDTDAYAGEGKKGKSLVPGDGLAPLRIGARTGTSFNGPIDDVRVYTRALSDAEINALFEGGPSPNQPPTANAGPDQTVGDADGDGKEPVTLNGSGSDPDGTIVSYLWTEGATVLGSTASLTAEFDIINSPHTVTLTVTDDGGATDSDTVVITVEDSAAPPPPSDGTWSSGDLEPGVWTESGNPAGRNARKDYNFVPPSSITTIGQVTVRIRASAYSSSGSDGINTSRPSLEIWTKRKGQLLQQIGGTITPTGPDTFSFESTGPSGIVLGEGNQLRIMIKSLNRDKASNTNDQVDIDLVEVHLTPQP